MSPNEDLNNKNYLYANNVNCSGHILEKLLDDNNNSIVLAAIKNNKLSIENFKKLILKSDLIRSSLAVKEECPIEILEFLSNDNIWYVRSSVAESSNCTSELLDKLSNDNYINVIFFSCIKL